MFAPKPSGRRNHRLCVTILLAAAIPLSGCDAWHALRAFFHPEEEGKSPLGNAGLHVEVDPPDGITIVLDDARVASLSPFKSDTLTAGPHRLEVRAMGYHPLTMNLELRSGETIHVPLQLRRRDEPPPPPKPSRRKSQPADAPPPPPPVIGVEVPPGVKPIPLQIVAMPKATINHNGNAANGQEVVLDRVRGNLDIGAIALRYRIGGAGLLFLTLPAEHATWQKDGRSLQSGATVKINPGVTRLVRDAEGETQTLLIRR